MSSLLRVRNLSKSYPSGQEILRVLIDLDLELVRGQIVAVTGASGSGKSTLLHLIGAMDQPDSGHIELEGTQVTELRGATRAQFRNRKIGFVFQFHYLLPEFTACENVMFPLLMRSVAGAAASERAMDLLGEVGLADRAEHRPGQLSGGEQQRVALARALVGEPSLLLADEPTGNLDEHTSDAVFDLLLEIRRQRDLSAIIVTHNLKLASRCHAQNRLHNGRLVGA